MLHIIYPDDRFVDEKTVRMWLSDAIANHEIEMIGDKTVVEPHEVDTLPIETVIKLLDDTGHVTFAH